MSEQEEKQVGMCPECLRSADYCVCGTSAASEDSQADGYKASASGVLVGSIKGEVA